MTPGAVVVREPAGRAERGSARLLLAMRAVHRHADRAGLPGAAGLSVADLAYARGQYPSALAGYVAEVAADHAGPASWAGLAIARNRCPGGGDATALDRRPELVRALYLRVRELGRTPPDPVALARWLSLADESSSAIDTCVRYGNCSVR